MEACAITNKKFSPSAQLYWNKLHRKVELVAYFMNLYKIVETSHQTLSQILHKFIYHRIMWVSKLSSYIYIPNALIYCMINSILNKN